MSKTLTKDSNIEMRCECSHPYHVTEFLVTSQGVAGLWWSASVQVTTITSSEHNTTASTRCCVFRSMTSPSLAGRCQTVTYKSSRRRPKVCGVNRPLKFDVNLKKDLVALYIYMSICLSIYLSTPICPSACLFVNTAWWIENQLPQNLPSIWCIETLLAICHNIIYFFKSEVFTRITFFF